MNNKTASAAQAAVFCLAFVRAHTSPCSPLAEAP